MPECEKLKMWVRHGWPWPSVKRFCYHMRMQRGNTSSRVCAVQIVTFQSLDLETSLLVCRYIFRVCRSDSYIKVIESRSRSQKRKGHTSVTKSDCICAHLLVVHLRLKDSLVVIFVLTHILNVHVFNVLFVLSRQLLIPR